MVAEGAAGVPEVTRADIGCILNRGFEQQLLLQKDSNMRMRMCFLAIWAAGGLMLSGCGGAENENEPPPGTDTKVESLDIDEGIPAAPGEPIPGAVIDEDGDDTAEGEKKSE